MIYHLPASLLKTFAEVEAEFDPRQKIMQLDDNCAVDQVRSARLRMYMTSYREIILLWGGKTPTIIFL